MGGTTVRHKVRAISDAAPTPTLDEVRGWPATVGVPETCRALGISRAHGYGLAQRGQFPCRVIRVGGSYRVVTASLIKLLEGDEPPLDAA